MTSTPEHHVDVGAYLLGLLDDRDREAFERHLRDCPQCTADAEALGGLEPVLAEFAEYADVRGLAAPPPGPAEQSPLLDRLLDDVSAARSRSRRRRLLAVAAAAVLVVGGPVVAVTVASRPGTTSVATALGEEQHTATDAGSGVTATVGLSPRAWGTDVGLRLSGVRGPLSCTLVAVSRTGGQQVVLTWLVPDSGYGVTGAAGPLVVHGGAAILRPDLDHFEVRTVNGAALVTIPV
ncbi:zf-HC2 domain-containing protein [Peterkaempfera griseoplana]|uniref:zf-HC2 domain-containing protein n=1 Tax=Peterkaempfera griseoplana TaxID=66896 RepID=UPI0006E3CAF9|nr:zf-HC2 domain-containing protein [Peterkaempfera griseoplana]